MTYKTDEHLKSYLNTNQLSREQMCLAILATDKRFTDVRPRHPSGGRDGGRDIEAVFQDSQRAFGAVGFVNNANDSTEQKKAITKKFKADAKSSWNVKDKPNVFLFLTNLALTISEKADLAAHARKLGFSYCEIFDRERLRIDLDQPSGFFIRFQYLDIPLTNAEQASFLAKYGDQIQSIVTSGYDRMDIALQRLTFLLESQEVLGSLHVHVNLGREYSAEEIGHFRLFFLVHLREVKHKIWAILFGSSDLSERMSAKEGGQFTPQISGIRHGIGTGQWERHLDLERYRNNDETIKDGNATSDDPESDTLPGYVFVGSGSAGGLEKTAALATSYRHDQGILRFDPRLSLRDLDGAMIMPIMNLSLAEKMQSFQILANGYKIEGTQRGDFRIDRAPFEISIPVSFSEAELADPWVRIRPSSGSSNFSFEFYNRTPKRLFVSPEIADTLSPEPKGRPAEQTR